MLLGSLLPSGRELSLLRLRWTGLNTIEFGASESRKINPSFLRIPYVAEVPISVVGEHVNDSQNMVNTSLVLQTFSGSYTDSVKEMMDRTSRMSLRRPESVTSRSRLIPDDLTLVRYLNFNLQVCHSLGFVTLHANSTTTGICLGCPGVE